MLKWDSFIQTIYMVQTLCLQSARPSSVVGRGETGGVTKCSPSSQASSIFCHNSKWSHSGGASGYTKMESGMPEEGNKPFDWICSPWRIPRPRIPVRLTWEPDLICMETQSWPHIPATVGTPGTQAPTLRYPNIQKCKPATVCLEDAESPVVGGRDRKTQSSAFQLTSWGCWTAQACVRRKTRRLVWEELPSLLLTIPIEHHHQRLPSFYLPWHPPSGPAKAKEREFTFLTNQEMTVIW